MRPPFHFDTNPPRGCLHSPLMSLFIAPLLVTIIAAYVLQDARFETQEQSRGMPPLALTVVVVPHTSPSSGEAPPTAAVSPTPPPSGEVPLPTLAPTALPLVPDRPPVAPAGAAPVQPAANPAAPGSQDAVCDTGTIVGVAALSIRAAPTRQSARIGEVAAGQVVQVLCGEPIAADERIWLRVRYGALVGYMSDRYVRVNGRPSGSTSQTVAGDTCGRARVVDVAALAIRAEPTRQSAQLGSAPAGATVEVLCDQPVVADERVWLRVRFGPVEGYMSDRYLIRESE